MMIISCKQNMPGNDLKIFNYNQASGISSLDPAFASLQSNIWAVNQVYNGLVQVNEKLEVTPSLAKSWFVSPDGLTYTFQLRDNVFFQKDTCFNNRDRKFIANDVVYSFERLVNPATAAKGAWVFNDKIDTINPFTAINDSTFQLKLIKPFPALLGILTMQYCFIVPKEAVDYYGKDFRKHPVGTGPFQFSFWIENEALVFLKNKNYFEKDKDGNSLPYLDGIRISFNDSKTTEFLQFKLKALDWIVDLDAGVRNEVLTKSGALQKSYENNFILKKNNYLNTEYIGINLEKAKKENSPLADVRVRKAINLAINKNELLVYIRNGIGRTAEYGIVPAGMTGYNQSLLDKNVYDITQSKKLLYEVGYNENNKMPSITIQCNSSNEALCLFVANQLKQVGIEMRVEAMQGKSLNEQMVKGNSLLFRASWIADYPDAESYLALCYGGYQAPPNYTRMRNENFDKLYLEAMNISNDSIRNNLYVAMDKIIMNELSIIPLYYDEVLDFIQLNISGFEVNALNLLDLRKVKKN